MGGCFQVRGRRGERGVKASPAVVAHECSWISNELLLIGACGCRDGEDADREPKTSGGHPAASQAGARQQGGSGGVSYRPPVSGPSAAVVAGEVAAAGGGNLSVAAALRARLKVRCHREVPHCGSLLARHGIHNDCVLRVRPNCLRRFCLNPMSVGHRAVMYKASKSCSDVASSPTICLTPPTYRPLLKYDRCLWTLYEPDHRGGTILGATLLLTVSASRYNCRASGAGSGAASVQCGSAGQRGAAHRDDNSSNS